MEWVFLDIGWTLVDETLAHRARWDAAQELLRGWGILRSTDELMQRSYEAATAFAASPFLHVLGSLGLSDAQQQIVLRAARYAKECKALYPGACEVVRQLASTFSLGVIANQSAGTQERLDRWGMGQDISLVLASAELGLAKPDPRIFEAALAQAGCRADEAVMVGDRLDNDIGPARRQGWRTIRIRQGFARSQVPRGPDEAADRTIDSIGELPAALRSLDDHS